MTRRNQGPLRILHVVGSMSRAGAETMIMSVYRQLDRRRVQFDFATHTGRAGDFDSEVAALGGRLLALPDPTRAGLRLYRRALARTLLEAGPFAGVHSHVYSFSGYVLRTAEQGGISLRIAHSHNTSDGRPDSLPRAAYRWTMQRLIYRHATHLFGCSRAACEALYGTHCWRDRRVRVVLNAFDLEAYTSAADERPLRRAALSLPQDALLVGHVGRFSAQKNHRFLIEIFAVLLQQVPSAHLVLVGDGPLRPEIEEMVAAMGMSQHVHWLGVRSDVPHILGALDLFLFPSRYEGMGIALIEAQAAGLPCVAADAVPAEADVGLGLVRFESLRAGPKAWAQSILEAVHTPRPEPARRHRALQEAGYGIGQMSQFLQQVYLGGAP